MSTDPQASSDWVDGFLFVANHPILDLLNTKPVLADSPTELLADVRALERWLIASGTVGSARGKNALKGWRNSTEAEAFLRELIAFRERLSDAVLRIENGMLPSEGFVSEMNKLLLLHPQSISLRKRDNKLVREPIVEFHKPTDLWIPIVDATADLLANMEPSRMRKCESCVVHFFDTSKKGSRRWCSMNICGNRVKVAAYRQRNRTADAS